MWYQIASSQYFCAAKSNKYFFCKWKPFSTIQLLLECLQMHGIHSGHNLWHNWFNVCGHISVTPKIKFSLENKSVRHDLKSYRSVDCWLTTEIKRFEIILRRINLVKFNIRHFAYDFFLEINYFTLIYSFITYFPTSP